MGILTPEARQALAVPSIKYLPIAELSVPYARSEQMFLMVLNGRKKPENLSIAESATWDAHVQSVDELKDDKRPWNLPTT